jgi:hypothetical protein
MDDCSSGEYRNIIQLFHNFFWRRRQRVPRSDRACGNTYSGRVRCEETEMNRWSYSFGSWDPSHFKLLEVRTRREPLNLKMFNFAECTELFTVSQASNEACFCWLPPHTQFPSCPSHGLFCVTDALGFLWLRGECGRGWNLLRMEYRVLSVPQWSMNLSNGCTFQN